MILFNLNHLNFILILLCLLIVPSGTNSQENPVLDSLQPPDSHVMRINRDSTRLRVLGSTTIQPIVETASQVFPGYPAHSFIIKGGGSRLGIDAVMNGAVDLGMVSRELTDQEKSQLAYTIIGYDALAIIVHSTNPIEKITRDEIQRLYTGTKTHWQDNPEGVEVLLISKMTGRGTLSIFEEYSGLRSPFNPSDEEADHDHPKISIQAWEAGANLDSILWVGGLKGAIGFVSALEAYQYIAHGMPIKILYVDGYYPDIQTIVAGLYPMRRYLKLVYLPENQTAKEFAEFMLSETGQSIVQQKGFVSLDLFDDPLKHELVP